MKFIITIKDEFGNVLSEHSATAEPNYMSSNNSYLFKFDPFYMMISGDAYQKYIDKVRMNDNE